MYLLFVLVVQCLLLLFVCLKHSMSYWQRRGIPHEEPSFFNGNVAKWRETQKRLVDVFHPMYVKYKTQMKQKLPFVGFYYLRVHAVLAIDIDFIKSVLIKDFNLFHERGLYFNETADPLTAHLFRLGGPKWRPLRQKLSPTFSSGKMKNMFALVSDIGKEFKAVVAERLADKPQRRDTLEITDLMGRFTADVIGTCAFGLKCNSLRDPQAEFAEMARRSFIERRHGRILTYIIETYPKLAKLMRLKNVPDEITDFYFRIVRDTIKQRKEQQIKRNDFMDILIELLDQGEITVEEIVAQAFIFLIAGFDTSSVTMSFALYELAKKPELQNRLRKEINEVSAKHNGEFNFEVVGEMTYLEQVISETLRKYPVLPQLIRQCETRYTPAGFDPKFYLDKGTRVYIPVHSIHYDEEFYPNPEEFDPERFTAAAIKSRPACTFLPFGDGPRNCIGLRFGKMQVCIGLYNMIKHFKFSVCDKTEMPLQFNVSSSLLCPLNGIYLQVEQIE